MPGFSAYSAPVVRLVFGIALLWAFSGCTGDLVYRPKKVIKPVVDIDAMFHLPPMPDARENDATLAGIDTSGMSIRDDIHIWIYHNYTTPVKRTGLMTVGQSLQKLLVSPPKTVEDAKKLELSYQEASQKLRAIQGLRPDEAETMDYLLYEHTFNTPARLDTYLNYDLLLAVETNRK